MKSFLEWKWHSPTQMTEMKKGLERECKAGWRMRSVFLLILLAFIMSCSLLGYLE